VSVKNLKSGQKKPQHFGLDGKDRPEGILRGQLQYTLTLKSWGKRSIF